MKTKIYLGSAEPPIHEQHLQIMTDFKNWQLIDLYVDHPDVLKMDATNLQYKDDFLEEIYASHLLEHLSHRKLPQILEHWYNKLKPEGRLIINVPDLVWAAQQVLKYENGQLLQSKIYTTFEGNNGLQSVIYGTHAHDGEYHKAGFTRKSLYALLEQADFKLIQIEKIYEAHEMGCLIATAIK